ncbi:MAG: hypothetical protein OJF49_000370 [Ktedonobacterales bacterium]|nr:MAG: hypothetical protein OJF49_000370 [Ktedonobacterales bacterium]
MLVHAGAPSTLTRTLSTALSRALYAASDMRTRKEGLMPPFSQAILSAQHEA